MAVKKGDKVRVLYEGTFEDGEVFDSSENHDNEPLEFVVGEGMVVKGFDDALLGMEIDETKKVTIKPEEGYGPVHEQAIQRIPKRMMPQDVEVGTEIEIPLENGEYVPATIVKIVSDLVTVDMNHPLAGKTLIFTITLKEIV